MAHSAAPTLMRRLFALAVVALSLTMAVGAATALPHHTIRQTTGPLDAPPECQAGCDPVLSILSAGCTPDACCTVDFDTRLFDCLNCVGTVLNGTASDYGVAQQELDGLNAKCAAAGIDIPKLTFPGAGGGSGGSAPNGSSTMASSSSTSVVFSSDVMWCGMAALFGGWVLEHFVG